MVWQCRDSMEGPLTSRQIEDFKESFGGGGGGVLKLIG